MPVREPQPSWNPSRLDKQITIQRSRIVGDDKRKEWYTVAMGVWAYVEERRGRDLLLASTEVFRADAIFVVRYRNDIMQGDRLLYNGIIFNVISQPREMSELGRGRATEILVKQTNVEGNI